MLLRRNSITKDTKDIFKYTQEWDKRLKVQILIGELDWGVVCIPLIFGFPTKFKQDASEAGRMCPRCNNAAVVGGSSRTWFEFFWVPLIPFSKSRIWVCSICQWEMKMGDGPDPQPPQAHGWGGGRPPPPNQFHQPGYGQQHV
ncbi:uncharacterized protein L201_001308 [Kwoniella dendrophila CBS 6074]|uniref:Zinc-ribbon 15 domain-containing protein n=1 Tax=Kwoniella dendrophila CBS 6074 TaxID=1295534 RepID=A0AAX4JLX7_9TREE